MLDKLEERQIYGKVVCSMIGGGNQIPGIEDNTYDAVTLSGGYAQGHLPVDALREVVRVVKPGNSHFPYAALVNSRSKLLFEQIFRDSPETTWKTAWVRALLHEAEKTPFSALYSVALYNDIVAFLCSLFHLAALDVRNK